MRIVQARPADAKLVAPLFAGYLKFYRKRATPTVIRKFLADRLLRRESVVFIAFAGNQAVGFVQLYPTWSSLSLKRLWILNDLFVVPAARRTGVANALMLRARQLAVATHAEGLILETAVTNRQAQRLYESLDWKRDTKFYRYSLSI
jgi:GNAT superfamily N-acetyltransferase